MKTRDRIEQSAASLARRLADYEIFCGDVCAGLYDGLSEEDALSEYLHDLRQMKLWLAGEIDWVRKAT